MPKFDVDFVIRNNLAMNHITALDPGKSITAHYDVQRFSNGRQFFRGQSAIAKPFVGSEWIEDKLQVIRNARRLDTGKQLRF